MLMPCSARGWQSLPSVPGRSSKRIVNSLVIGMVGTSFWCTSGTGWKVPARSSEVRIVRRREFDRKVRSSARLGEVARVRRRSSSVPPHGPSDHVARELALTQGHAGSAYRTGRSASSRFRISREGSGLSGGNKKDHPQEQFRSRRIAIWLPSVFNHTRSNPMPNPHYRTLRIILDNPTSRRPASSLHAPSCLIDKDFPALG